jgi:hypothetical protein
MLAQNLATITQSFNRDDFGLGAFVVHTESPVNAASTISRLATGKRAFDAVSASLTVPKQP